jgi:hypothetical protein
LKIEATHRFRDCSGPPFLYLKQGLLIHKYRDL